MEVYISIDISYIANTLDRFMKTAFEKIAHMPHPGPKKRSMATGTGTETGSSRRMTGCIVKQGAV
ncbi:MAG: hypothetical protein ACUVT7_02560, partial [Thermoplasmata archaeon]